MVLDQSDRGVSRAVVPDQASDGWVAAAGTIQEGVAEGMSGESGREEQLVGTIREQADRLVKLAEKAMTAAAASGSAAQRRGQGLRDAADARRAETIDRATAAASRAIATRVSSIREAQARLASGVLTEGWRSNDWYDLPVGSLAVASAVRVGQASLPKTDGPRVSIPLLAPLLNNGNLILNGGDPTERDLVLLRSVVLRALAGTGPGQLNLMICDPKIRGTFADLRELRNVSDVFPAPCTSADEIAAALTSATGDIARVRELLGGRHLHLGELRAAAGQPIEAYRMIVMLDFPASVSPEAFDLVVRLLESGPACGTSLLIQLDATLPTPQDRDVDDVLHAGFVVDRRGAVTRARALPEFSIDLDPAPPRELVSRIVELVAEAARTGAAPAIPFRDLVPVSSTPTESSANGISAVVGRSGTDPVTITLGDPLEQRHNLLVAGAVGQGKSNLLLVLIHSLASRYSADELEMYLLDFKEGLEFSQLAGRPGRPHWLPNARVLGLESDREFGVAVLGHLIGEFNRRASVIKPYGNNIARYREASPEHTMPRILIVIDEFQVLLAEDDGLADQSLQSLETLARRTRACGMHLVLASQTLSGIRNLAMVEGAIFGQFPTRLALKTSATESQVVLSNGNTEASKLRYRGEAVVNHEFGGAQGNHRVTIAYADEADLDRLRRNLWKRRARRAKPPVVFYGNRPSSLTAGDGTRRIALLGRAVGVDDEPIGFVFSDEPGRHLAIIGDGTTTASPGEHSGTNMAFGAIHGAVASLAAFHASRPARFVLLDFLSADQQEAAHLDELAAHATATCVVERFQGRRASRELCRLADRLQQAVDPTDEPMTYVVAIGLHRAPGMDAALDDAGPSGAEALRALIRSGPIAGVHVIGWWGNCRSYSEHVNYEVDGYVKGILALKMPHSDAASLFGPFISWVPRDHRGLLTDRDNFATPRTLIPFAPLGEQLA